jgi:hypothetical protein
MTMTEDTLQTKRRISPVAWPSKVPCPLRHNGYKVPLMRNLVKRAIRGTGGAPAVVTNNN